MIKWKRTRIVILIWILCVSLLSSGYYLTNRLDQSFGAEPDTLQTLALTLQNQSLSVKGYLIDQAPFLPVSVIGTSLINSNITVDQVNRRLVFDLSSLNLMMADDATTNFVKSWGGSCYIPLREINGILCFPLNETQQFFHITYAITSNSIKMRNFTSAVKVAKVNRNNISATPSLIHDTVAPILLSQGDTVLILDQTDNYYLVETADDLSAYIGKDVITISEIDLSKVDFYAPKKKKYDAGSNRISVAWQYFSSKSLVSHPTEKYEGLDILCPTWFELLVGGDGSSSNYGQKGYTDAAHDLGYQVWATVTNSMSTTGSTDFTTHVFNDTKLLNRSVAQYLFYSCLYDVDGINIDYEDVKDADASGLTAFTALMRHYTDRQGLNLSIDTKIPKPWTIEYDRDQLEKYVDYLVVMTYDQHYVSSPAAGSVASLPWVEEAIVETLKEVPSTKVLLGVPLYTRIWTTDASNKLIGNVSATMSKVAEVVTQSGLSPVWLDTEKQYYVQYPNGININKIWIEDKRSISYKLDLVSKYNLGGSASWQLSQGVPGVWEVYQGMLHQGANKNDYQLPYGNQ